LKDPKKKKKKKKEKKKKNLFSRSRFRSRSLRLNADVMWLDRTQTETKGAQLVFRLLQLDNLHSAALDLEQEREQTKHQRTWTEPPPSFLFGENFNPIFRCYFPTKVV
jgi:hypothetical protein